MKYKKVFTTVGTDRSFIKVSPTKKSKTEKKKKELEKLFN